MDYDFLKKISKKIPKSNTIKEAEMTKQQVLVVYAHILGMTVKDAVAVAHAICYLDRLKISQDKITDILVKNNLPQEVRNGLEILSGRTKEFYQIPEIDIPEVKKEG